MTDSDLEAGTTRFAPLRLSRTGRTGFAPRLVALARCLQCSEPPTSSFVNLNQHRGTQTSPLILLGGK